MIRGDRTAGGHGDSHKRTEGGFLRGIVECQRQKADHNIKVTEKVGDKPNVVILKVHGT